METLCVRYDSLIDFVEDCPSVYRSDLIKDTLHITDFIRYPVKSPINSYNQIIYSKYEINGIVESVFENNTYDFTNVYYRERFVVIKVEKLRFCIFWSPRLGSPPIIGDNLTGLGELNLGPQFDTINYFNKNDNPELFNYFLVRKIHQVNPPTIASQYQVIGEDGREFIETKDYLMGSEYITEQHILEVESMNISSGLYFLMDVNFLPMKSKKNNVIN